MSISVNGLVWEKKKKTLVHLRCVGSHYGHCFYPGMIGFLKTSLYEHLLGGSCLPRELKLGTHGNLYTGGSATVTFRPPTKRIRLEVNMGPSKDSWNTHIPSPQGFLFVFTMVTFPWWNSYGGSGAENFPEVGRFRF